MTRREFYELLAARRSRIAGYPETASTAQVNIDPEGIELIKQVSAMRFAQLQAGKYDEATRG